MREIKFRAWINGKMRTDCLVALNDGSVGVSVHQLEAEGIRVGTADEVLVMQFTGLKDKNGKEIYEGDVVEGQKDVYPRSVIGFEDGSFVIKQAPLAKWKVSHFELEVIGNIYENPELLTK